jgi:hypothetical protein
MATMAVMMKGGSVRGIVNRFLASPRVFVMDAPIIEGRGPVGTAHPTNSPGVNGTLAVPVGTRITIGSMFPRPPKSSTQEGAATEWDATPNPMGQGSRTQTQGVEGPVAIDTDVALARIHVDDPRDSGAAKRRPGAFINIRDRNSDPVSQRRFGN